MDILWALECRSKEPLWRWNPMLQQVLRSLDLQGFIPLNNAVLVPGGRESRLRSAEHLFQVAGSWGRGLYHVLVRPDQSEYKLTVSITDQSMSLWLHLGGEELARRRGTLASQLASVMKQAAEESSPMVYFEIGSELSIRNLGYPHVRPPRSWGVCGQSSVLDLVDMRSRTASDQAESIRRLHDLKTPENVQRTEIGEVLLLQWASDQDVADETALRVRLSEREQWLAGALDAPIKPGWNPEGDLIVELINARPHPPLTLYSPALATGYKAIHTSTPKPTIENDLRQAAAWIKRGSLEDGTVLSDVVVIAESRAAALALRPLALELGTPHIIYVGPDQRLWDPFPPGEWLPPVS